MLSEEDGGRGGVNTSSGVSFLPCLVMSCLDRALRTCVIAIGGDGCTTSHPFYSELIRVGPIQTFE